MFDHVAVAQRRRQQITRLCIYLACTSTALTYSNHIVTRTHTCVVVRAQNKVSQVLRTNRTEKLRGRDSRMQTRFSSFRMYPRPSTGPNLDWATRSVLSPGWDTPRIPGAPAASVTTTPVGVTWTRATRGCIAPAAIAWGTRWWRRAEAYAARRSSSTWGGTFRHAPAHATTWAMGITWTIRWVDSRDYQAETTYRLLGERNTSRTWEGTSENGSTAYREDACSPVVSRDKRAHVSVAGNGVLHTIPKSAGDPCRDISIRTRQRPGRGISCELYVMSGAFIIAMRYYVLSRTSH